MTSRSHRPDTDSSAVPTVDFPTSRPPARSFHLTFGALLALMAVLTPSSPAQARAAAPALHPKAELPGVHAVVLPADEAISALLRIEAAQIAPAMLPGVEPQQSAEPPDADTAAPLTVESLVETVAPERGPAVESLGRVTDPAVASADLWGRIRSGFSFTTQERGEGQRRMRELVAHQERRFTASSEQLSQMLERGSRYLFHIVEEVQKRGMPTELALLPFVESAFNPQAMSSARAAGMWQFIPSTGRTFDLRQNAFRDERRDVLASTRAALDYLARLNAQFGNWAHALAAYNWGEGRVRQAIARNARAGRPTDFASLAMPRETRQYVPKLLALRNLVERPQDFALALPRLENHPYFISVPVGADIDADLAAQLAGLSPEEFRSLNPSLNRPLIMASGMPQILLPYDNADQFVTNLAEYRGRLASWTVWVAPRSMSPAEAARQTGMTEPVLRSLNHIPPRGVMIHAGSSLLIPRSERRAGEDVPERLADSGMVRLSPEAGVRKSKNVKSGKPRHRSATTRPERNNSGNNTGRNLQSPRSTPNGRLARGSDSVD